MSEPSESFAAFVRASEHSLLRLAWALTGDRHTGEDLAQATLERLWARWDRVSAEGNPWPYTQKIATTLYCTWWRRRWRGEAPSEAVPEGVDPDPSDNVVTATLISSWLATLPPRQRTVIVLRFLCDLSVQETADVLGCSSGTVKSQTSKALRALQDKGNAFRQVEGASL